MKKILLITGGVLLVAAAFLTWHFYGWIYTSNTQEGSSNVLYIRDTTDYTSLSEMLDTQGILINAKAFDWVAKRMSFGDKGIKAGRYYIPPGMNNYSLIQKLRLGEQDAIELIINGQTTLEEVAGTFGTQLQYDSTAFLAYLRDTFLPESQYSAETILCLFIPNTYEVWWSLTPEKLMQRMLQEHDRFWNATRAAQAEAQNLTPCEVYTLASIVESETQAKEERRTIAGVYLNRLDQSIPLQADPTVRFALRDKTIKRVLLRHLEIDSPYNTYIHTGLPPGPIAMPTIHSIDAVLNPEAHDYLFFCAKPGYEGRHAFARTLSAHLTNAREYQSWLDSQGIR